MNLHPYVKDAFEELNWLICQDPKQELVYHHGIPILYFGNLKAYSNSSLRIVTTALNPANNELHKDGIYSTRYRFPSYNPILKEVSYPKWQDSYLKSLDSYFEENPYNWFSLGFEPVLNGLKASYYGKAETNNRVLHTDLGSPVCTKKLWSDLPKHQKNHLVMNGKKLWFNLMKELQPHVILISISEKLMEEVFGVSWKTKAIPVWNSEEAARRRGSKDLLESGSIRKKPFLAYEFTHDDLPLTKIIWGKANTKPFGDLAFRNDPKSRIWLGEDLKSLIQ